MPLAWVLIAFLEEKNKAPKVEGKTPVPCGAGRGMKSSLSLSLH